MKKLFAVLLCLSMLLSVFPVLAEDAPLIGSWVLMDVEGPEDATAALQMLMLLGGSYQIIFTETQMTLCITIDEEQSKIVSTYTIEGNMIYNDGGGGVEYAFVDDRLTLTYPEDEILLFFARKSDD